MSKKEREISEFEMDWEKFFVCALISLSVRRFWGKRGKMEAKRDAKDGLKLLTGPCSRSLIRPVGKWLLKDTIKPKVLDSYNGTSYTSILTTCRKNSGLNTRSGD